MRGRREEKEKMEGKREANCPFKNERWRRLEEANNDAKAGKRKRKLRSAECPVCPLCTVVLCSPLKPPPARSEVAI